MSLTSQIKNKDSPVSQFFTKYENKNGANECLAFLQSTKSMRPLAFTPMSSIIYSFIGITTDYLIRYSANGNKLIFENTIAHQVLIPVSDYEPNCSTSVSLNSASQYLEDLYDIAKQYLDGRLATDFKAVYSATCLAIMDNIFRSGRFPRFFFDSIQKCNNEQIKKIPIKECKEKETKFFFDEYYYKILGGELYAQDISELIKTFLTVRQTSGSEFYNAQFTMFNQALGNSWLVGGADFDCVIKCKNRLILTDIKTMIKPLTIEHFRQILGYALLFDEEKENFKFTDIGIYHSRSGSFRFLSLNNIIKRSLPSFKSVNQARKAFVATLASSLGFLENLELETFGEK